MYVLLWSLFCACGCACLYGWNARVLNVGPLWRSHLVCFQRSTAPARQFSLMTVPLVSPTWKAQSNGQWRFTLLLHHFYIIVYSYMYTLKSYIIRSTNYKMHVKNNLEYCWLCFVLHVDISVLSFQCHISNILSH